ncbi:MAG: sugar isomerase domain-containing protein [Lentisphaeria bacterium]|nr:sugar isomerase domain-containing protein [Lentisphaeria bacterium]MBQ7397146.1 sugar isomerase domain-containing protein [Lentisphaeria bacterium]
MSLINDYLQQVSGVLQKISDGSSSLEEAAGLIADAYIAGNNIYVFGCTHSAILAEDVFYRAGAPAFWRPLWGPGMSITTTPGFLTSAVEHNEEIGKAVISCSRVKKDDVLVVISTSGKNAAPVAVAEEAAKRGAKLVIITSSNYREQKGNHSSIANLWHFTENAVIIDNCVPCGDASIVAAEKYPMGPVSTIAGSFIMHTISALAIEKIAATGMTAPVFLSSNAPGGAEHNGKLLDDPKMQEAYLLP